MALPLRTLTFLRNTLGRRHYLMNSDVHPKVSPSIYPSLEERLAEHNKKIHDPELYKKVDIGFKGSLLSRSEKKQRQEQWKLFKANPLLEKEARSRKLEISLKEVEKEWLCDIGVKHISRLADYFGIFKDLFGEFAYFYPRVPLHVEFPFDEETVSPVYFGNVIKPAEAKSCPTVNWESTSEDELWTLVMTSPDGNLYENSSECLHWLVSNIKGNDLSTGDTLVDYLQPFPPQGCGYLRYVFLLFKQKEKVDLEHFRREQPCLNLKSRTFSTEDFYRPLQDTFTPAGLSFFQSDFDNSLMDFYHNTLDMKVPVFEYDFPKPYYAPSKQFPRRKPFQVYLDIRRDPKEVDEEVLKMRLAKMDPFLPEPPLDPYPHAVPLPLHLPSWIRTEMKKARGGRTKYYGLFRGNHRPAFTCKRPFGKRHHKSEYVPKNRKNFLQPAF